MRIGTVSIELEVSLRFHDDGTLSEVADVALGGRPIPGYLREPLVANLSVRAPWDKVVADCWENSEPADD